MSVRLLFFVPFVHHFNLTLLSFYYIHVINSLYLSWRVSAIDNQESNIKSLLADPNQSLFTVVTLVFSVCVCRTNPTQHPHLINFSFAADLWNRVHYIGVLFNLLEQILAVDCMFSHIGVAFNNCKPREQTMFPNLFHRCNITFRKPESNQSLHQASDISANLQ